MSSKPGPMVGGFTTLPLSGPELERFEAWLHGAGGVRLTTTSEWEVARWKFGKATLILYRNAREVRKWTCNDYGVLNTLEKAMRAEWRAERAAQVPSVPDKPTPRQRVRGTPAPRSGPSGAMDIIEPSDHQIAASPVVAAPETVHGVTRLKHGNFNARAELKRLLCERQEWRCFYCGVGVALTETAVNPLATLEHVVPKSSGGPDISANLVIACRPCNQTVGSMSVYEKILFRDTLTEQRVARLNDTSIPF